jgi:hypothetical protein
MLEDLIEPFVSIRIFLYMVLLIDIFSINRSRGYEKFCLGYYCNRAFLCWRLPPRRGKSTFLSVIKVLFLVLLWYHFGIIVVLFWLYFCSSTISSILFMFCILFISGILQVVSEYFPRHKIVG